MKQKLSQQFKSHVEVIFTTIAPASLMKFRDHQIQRNKLYFSNFSDEHMIEMQKELEHDIEITSKNTCLLNKITMFQHKDLTEIYKKL